MYEQHVSKTSVSTPQDDNCVISFIAKCGRCLHEHTTRLHYTTSVSTPKYNQYNIYFMAKYRLCLHVRYEHIQEFHFHPSIWSVHDILYCEVWALSTCANNTSRRLPFPLLNMRKMFSRCVNCFLRSPGIPRRGIQSRVSSSLQRLSVQPNHKRLHKDESREGISITRGSLRKHVYSNLFKISPPLKVFREKFWYFSHFC